MVAGRLPAALLGIASLVLIFVLARRMAGNTFALVTLLFACLSPLHIQYSRVAHEGAIVPGFFVILILFLWHSAAARGYPLRVLIALGFATGLSSSSYQTTRLTAAVFALVILADVARASREKLRALAAFGTGFIIGALPQLIAMVTEPDRFFARARVLLSPTDGPVAYVTGILTGYALNFEPRYLFLPERIFDLAVARLLPVEVLFFYAGLVAFAWIRIEPPSRARIWMYLALAISLLPAALTPGNPNTLRASGITVLTPFFSAAGLILIGSWIRSGTVRRRLYYPVAIASVVLVAGVLTWKYTQSHFRRETTFHRILVELGTKLARHEVGYDAVVVEKTGGQLYMYLVAFGGMSPREFQRGPKEFHSVGMDQFTSVGKYRLVDREEVPREIASAAASGRRTLLVAARPYPGLERVDSVWYRPDTMWLLRHPARVSPTAAGSGARPPLPPAP